MAAPKTVADMKELIHQTATGTVEEPIEYEPDDYQNMDAIDEDDVEELEAVAEEEAPAEEAAPSTVDWQAIARQQQEELARYKMDQAEREKADFERRVNELPVEERADYILNFYKERERAFEMEKMRAEQAQAHPLATVLFAPIMERFDMEVDDPEVYAEAMDAMEARYMDIVNSIVEERVTQEMEKFYAETGREWGTDKLGSAQPRPLQPRNPIRSQYEQTRKELAKPGVVKTTDDLTKLIRQRQMAK